MKKYVTKCITLSLYGGEGHFPNIHMQAVGNITEFRVLCEVPSFQCAVYTVKLALLSVQCAVYSVQREVCSVKCDGCSIKCAVCNVWWSVFSVQYARSHKVSTLITHCTP